LGEEINYYIKAEKMPQVFVIIVDKYKNSETIMAKI